LFRVDAEFVVNLDLGATRVEVDGALERCDLAGLGSATATKRPAERGREASQLCGRGASRFGILKPLLDLRIDGPGCRPRALCWSCCACHILLLPRTNRGALAEGVPRLNVPDNVSVWMRWSARSHTKTDAAVRQA
jgi:hypothetical protein